MYNLLVIADLVWLNSVRWSRRQWYIVFRLRRGFGYTWKRVTVKLWSFTEFGFQLIRQYTALTCYNQNRIHRVRVWLCVFVEHVFEIFINHFRFIIHTFDTARENVPAVTALQHEYVAVPCWAVLLTLWGTVRNLLALWQMKETAVLSTAIDFLRLPTFFVHICSFCCIVMLPTNILPGYFLRSTMWTSEKRLLSPASLHIRYMIFSKLRSSSSSYSHDPLFFFLFRSVRQDISGVTVTGYVWALSVTSASIDQYALFLYTLSFLLISYASALVWTRHFSLVQNPKNPQNKWEIMIVRPKQRKGWCCHSSNVI